MPSFTRTAIKRAFLKLLNEHPLNQISVRAIVEECGINRNSFYYHFQDIPALIEEIIIESFDGLIAEYPNITSINECFDAAFRFISENKKIILHIYTSVSRDIFEKNLMRYCEYMVSAYLKSAFDTDNSAADISDTDRRLVIRFLKCELFGSFIDLIDRGIPADAINEIDRMLEICHGLSAEFISRCRASE